MLRAGMRPARSSARRSSCASGRKDLQACLAVEINFLVFLVRLDIAPEMALRNGIPAKISEAQLVDLDTNPPAWLAQSRANRTGRKPVWVYLICRICGRSDAVRPKKWWPPFTYVSCADHAPGELPDVAPGCVRGQYDGIGARFVGVVDEPSPA